VQGERRQLDHVALLREAAQPVGDEAARGSKLLLGQRFAHQLFQLVQRQGSIHLPNALGRLAQ
jgi:hypothetical protein